MISENTQPLEAQTPPKGRMVKGQTHKATYYVVPSLEDAQLSLMLNAGNPGIIAGKPRKRVASSGQIGLNIEFSASLRAELTTRTLIKTPTLLAKPEKLKAISGQQWGKKKQEVLVKEGIGGRAYDLSFLEFVLKSAYFSGCAEVTKLYTLNQKTLTYVSYIPSLPPLFSIPRSKIGALCVLGKALHLSYIPSTNHSPTKKVLHPKSSRFRRNS